MDETVNENLPQPVSDYRRHQQREIENAENIVDLKWFRLYWVLFLTLCIVLIESLFKSGVALGTVIWFAMTEAVAISFAQYCAGTINKKALLLVVPIALINIGNLLFYSISVQMITWPVALALFALQLTYLAKPEKDRLFDFANIYDMPHTILINAFAFIPFPFKGLLKFKNEGSKSVVIHIIIGVLIAFPIACIFIALFSSADQSFAAIVNSLLENLFAEIAYSTTVLS